jgi:hypothetical protein
MPQPDSSRHHSHWNNAAPWPLDPAAPGRGSPPGVRQAPRPKPDAEQDGRTPDDRDGNEELAREQQSPSSRHARARSRGEVDEDTGRWVATERFAADAELDDTLPNVPRYTDD